MDFFEYDMGFSLMIPHFRVEHPAGGYKKLFETVEELSSPLTAHVTGGSHQSWSHPLFFFDISLLSFNSLEPLFAGSPTGYRSNLEAQDFYAQNSLSFIYLFFISLMEKSATYLEFLEDEDYTFVMFELFMPCLSQYLAHCKGPINICSVCVNEWGPGDKHLEILQ